MRIFWKWEWRGEGLGLSWKYFDIDGTTSLVVVKKNVRESSCGFGLVRERRDIGLTPLTVQQMRKI